MKHSVSNETSWRLWCKEEEVGTTRYWRNTKQFEVYFGLRQIWDATLRAEYWRGLQRITRRMWQQAIWRWTLWVVGRESRIISEGWVRVGQISWVQDVVFSTQGMGAIEDLVYGVGTVGCFRHEVQVELIIYYNFSIEICGRVNFIHRLWFGE